MSARRWPAWVASGGIAATLALSFAASAQMRPGQPQVLSPAAAPTQQENTPWAALRGRLGSHNRVMLFWESTLDDSVSTRYRDVQTLDRQVHGNAAQVDGVIDSAAGPLGVAVAGGNAHLHQRSESFVEGEGPAHARLSADARAMQSVFMAQLRQGGVRFIDRALATRLAGGTVEGERPNVHAIETRALTGHADYLMEVTSSADADARSGRRFHVSLRSVSDGETVVDFDTSADTGSPATMAYVATANGFERGTPTPASEADTARVLATETGRRMADAMVRR
ncbi:hypothetical protein [Pseudoxanthomonas dokdonensis]|uniref:Uncharacterized protein n=1 Tax=Pseudoxanthomonas dokdonensis TaxID=344882 RepID=A0A0R0CKT2_9GAMM|nr:hypothetical protein [Pseudoxanthomonas dokdonensis]KRG70527.1 hypothetical protein ABB29_05475 [Pseudoxanthomonas dokdonensis]